MPTVSTADLHEIRQAVRLLGAAFPRAAWRDESEAAYTLPLAEAGFGAARVRAAIASLIREEHELPPVARVLERCRAMAAGDLEDVACPECGSHLIAVDGGLFVCFDCDCEGVMS